MNEYRVSPLADYKVKWYICLNKGEPSSKAKYGIIRNSEQYREGNLLNSNFISSSRIVLMNNKSVPFA